MATPIGRNDVTNFVERMPMSREFAKCVVAVIPAYNEARFIGSVVVKTLPHVSHVIVVDDGSDDDTAAIARLAGAEVVSHAHNQGKGNALNSGFQTALAHHADVVVTLDADGQHLPDEMRHVIAPVLNGEADIVIGSRYLNSESHVPVARVVGHQFFNWFTAAASGLSISDSQSGFRAFSAKALAAHPFRSNGFSVESEMQFWAQQHALRVVEVPVTIRYLDRPKRPVISHGAQVLNGILRLTGQYRPLLFFGLSGLIVIFLGLLSGLWIVDIYRETQQLAVGYGLITVLLFVIGSAGLSTGIILHSIRGLLLEWVGGSRQ